MPKRNFVKVKLPALQPDRCLDCPLLGLVPKAVLPKGSLETYVCIGTFDAMTARYAKSRVSEADKKHPRHRWCEKYWPAWMQLPNMEFPVSCKAYNELRLPFDRQLQLQLPIRFNSKRK